MTSVQTTWVQGEQFIATGTGGHSVVLDAPGGRESWQGFKPSELLLAALAGCTGVDVIDILKKKRLHVTGLRVRADGVQLSTPPYNFTHITVHFEVRGRAINPQAVERAIALSQEKYCSVAATIRGVAEIATEFTIVSDDEATDH